MELIMLAGIVMTLASLIYWLSSISFSKSKNKKAWLTRIYLATATVAGSYVTLLLHYYFIMDKY